MLVADWLSELNRRLRFRKRARLRQGRGNHRWQVKAEVSLLEDRCLMSRVRADALVPMPSNTVASANDVLYYDKSVPLKEITLTNNTAHTIYPILIDANSAEDLVKGSPNYGLPLYDPNDQLNQEYRGYIGYTLNGQNYLGLRSGQQISINVPLVFWDAGRIEIATYGANLTPNATELAPNNPVNPFRYYQYNADGSPTARYAVAAIGPASTNGMVMWYHASGLAQGPANDAPAQLTEMTFRDPYLATLKTAADIAASEKITLVNYDVSYVDSILLPVAIEAPDVPIYPNNMNSVKKAYGWVGADKTYAAMQNAIAAFTSSDRTINGLGGYFGGRGYDKYYNPNPSATGIKLPAGQNLIGDSPFSGATGVRSSYDNNQYALVSGGVGPIEVFSGGSSQGNVIQLVPEAPASLLESLQTGMVVTDSSTDLKPNTTISRVDVAAKQVILNQSVNPTGNDNNVYTFERPVMDYVATKLTNLWYGWANYYVTNSQVPSVPNVTGTTAAGNNVITFNAPVAGLVPGMQIRTSSGAIPSGTTILGISSNDMSINLSTYATVSGSNSYTFAAPQRIVPSSEVNPFTLTFAASAQAKAYQFSQVVYAVMSAMSTIPPNSGLGSTSTQLMFNVLGGNLGMIPGIVPPSGVVPLISNELRDDIKSVMRGVYNFQAVPESTGEWYPNPATTNDGAEINSKPAKFDVYNLNPFVWFVHKQLGLSGYGFSLDDDVADVGAEGANQLQISVGGPQGLDQQVQWTWGAPYGPVSSVTGQISKGSTELTNLNQDVVAEVHGTDANAGLVGAKVTGPGIGPGTTILQIVFGGTTVYLSKPAIINGQASATNPYNFS